ncbi:MAG TPA: hypothetical protein VM451_00370 [Candidatus Limnocylindria bacterium]|nr:hypothetical protein [Candidatus Limnocylindria bacterium]
MQGIIRAIARLLVMGVVMAAVLIAAVLAGLGTITAIAIALVAAGGVGLAGVVRKPRKLTGVQEIEAMLAADPLDRAAAAALAAAKLPPSTAVEAMAPPRQPDGDPEASMPRWRRPSLLEARRSDPTHSGPINRSPMRFGDGASADLDVRVVRYAVVPVLDRPDEVLGLRLSDMGCGDEVQVLGSSGAFLEVLCPNGDQGWIHRTTLGQRGPAQLVGDINGPDRRDADDALTALLTARGMI